jgi:hypothetical protein
VTRDQYGRVTITEDEAFRALYSNTISNISDVNLDDSKIIWQFNEALLKNADRITALESLK